uniref:RRM domain-containing protein n=1 Tax=Rhabditophanes sp. KR3021 TaxID=114890 RepID=A0AC35TKI3_9BILA
MSRYNLFMEDNCQDRDDKTIYVRNLDIRVTKNLLWELFSQIGVVQDVFMPVVAADAKENPFALVRFKTLHTPIYACEMMDGVELFGRAISINPKGKCMHTELYTNLRKSGSLAYQIELDKRRDQARLHSRKAHYNSQDSVHDNSGKRYPQQQGSQSYGYHQLGNSSGHGGSWQNMNDSRGSRGDLNSSYSSQRYSQTNIYEGQQPHRASNNHFQNQYDSSQNHSYTGSNNWDQSQANNSSDRVNTNRGNSYNRNHQRTNYDDERVDMSQSWSGNRNQQAKNGYNRGGYNSGRGNEEAPNGRPNLKRNTSSGYVPNDGSQKRPKY